MDCSLSGFWSVLWSVLTRSDRAQMSSKVRSWVANRSWGGDHCSGRVGQLEMLVDLRREPDVAVPHECHGRSRRLDPTRRAITRLS